MKTGNRGEELDVCSTPELPGTPFRGEVGGKTMADHGGLVPDPPTHNVTPTAGAGGTNMNPVIQSQPSPRGLICQDGPRTSMPTTFNVAARRNPLCAPTKPRTPEALSTRAAVGVVERIPAPVIAGGQAARSRQTLKPPGVQRRACISAGRSFDWRFLGCLERVCVVWSAADQRLEFGLACT